VIEREIDGTPDVCIRASLLETRTEKLELGKVGRHGHASERGLSLKQRLENTSTVGDTMASQWNGAGTWEERDRSEVGGLSSRVLKQHTASCKGEKKLFIPPYSTRLTSCSLNSLG
jgi:hypothetical protein